MVKSFSNGDPMRKTGITLLFLFMLTIGSLPECFGAVAPPPPGPQFVWFSGYKWYIKRNEDWKAPGPYFSNSRNSVWVDEKGRLHLRISKWNGGWYCSEVTCEKSFGLGKYLFYLASPIDRFDKNVVLGLFTWSDRPAYEHREIDIEIARWGKFFGTNAQYVVQPWTHWGNMQRFFHTRHSVYTTHSFTWEKSRITFQSFIGPSVSANRSDIIQQWVCTTKDIPLPGDEKVHFNLFTAGNKSPSDGKDTEVIIAKFQFIK